eukprot:TRINITY_DN13596_c0_g2_i2.p1 TRINITY_DN13596_c0_g2~~TRINITY_DN13596_c0_g2_i2.p1  ORF type:complete len:583 (+),score=105.65 TRINITY_DN13596_c0_g2_i2:1060-2808(+)
MSLCLLCADETTIFGELECGHVTCWKCALRYRFKVNTAEGKEKAKLCCQCQTPSEKLWIYKNKKGSVRDPVWGVLCEDEDVLQEIKYLRDLFCPLYETCGVDYSFGSTGELRSHLLNKHQVTFCPVCLSEKPLFVSEQQLYTKAQLKLHESVRETCSKDPSNFRGHPKCHFCNMNMYDNEALTAHMQDAHILCELCERSDSAPKYLFYPNLTKLVQHWRESHHYCEKCHSKYEGDEQHHPTEWVFGSNIDLSVHNQKVHSTGNTKKGTKVDVGFGFGFGASSYDTNQGNTSHSSDRGGNRDDYANGADSIRFSMGKGREIVYSLSLPVPESEEGKGGKGGRGVSGQEGGKGRGRGRGGRSPKRDSHPTRSPPPPQPTESEKSRNLELMKKMKTLLGDDVAKFNQFRVISSEFLKGNMQSAEYYDKLQLYFGGSLSDIFSDLVDLLPDANKRQGLRLVHNTANSKEKGIPDTPPTTVPAADPKKLLQQQLQEFKKQQQPHSKSPSRSSNNWLDKAKKNPTGAGGGTAVVQRSVTPPPARVAETDPSDFPTLGGDKKKKPTKMPKIGKQDPKGNIWAQKAMQRK